MPTPASSRAAAEAGVATKKWTRENVAAVFLTPAEAGLTGGETRTDPQGTITHLGVCVALDPLNSPMVTIDKRYATAEQEIGLPYKGHLTQQGWVLPAEADASRVMTQARAKLSQCRYAGNTKDPIDPHAHISATSTPHAYPRDSFGWHGQRIEQAMSRDGTRVSVSTVLLLQRGPVLLALDYTNYTPKTPQQSLHDYNMTILRKVLAHPA